MENFINKENALLEEIKISIKDSEKVYYGGDQHWFPKKMHQLSGCGPVAAANIAAYLAKAFPDKYCNLFPYSEEINKRDFIEHMVEVRKYVIPGDRGLTSVDQFADNLLSFSRSRGVELEPHILHEEASMGEAVSFITEALEKRLPVAILVLKHPVKELEDYTWHWMTITHLVFKADDSKYYIYVSSYGEQHIIDLDLLWNHRTPTDIIRLAYFE